MMLSRYKGALVGAVVGDCIGANFEGAATVKMSDILSLCDKIKQDHSSKKAKEYLQCFTDDTAMARSVMKSLIYNRGFNAEDMAMKFFNEFYDEPNRGYGGNIVTVFSALMKSDFKDVFQPAREQFDGSGSYGNGGAMRIVPAPLFAFYKKDAAFLEKLTRQITELTHTHPHAVHGAILQAMAVHASLKLPNKESLNCDQFCDKLIEKLKPIETNAISDQPSSPKSMKPKRALDADPTPYCAKLEKVKDFVKEEKFSVKQVENVLGNDVSALGSVPAAVLSFLRGSTHNIKDVNEDNPFKRVILLAISLGGDTDTIATMAGAMAGALYGLEAIPVEWTEMCEGVEDALVAAESLFELASEDNGQQESTSDGDKAKDGDSTS